MEDIVILEPEPECWVAMGVMEPKRGERFRIRLLVRLKDGEVVKVIGDAL